MEQTYFELEAGTLPYRMTGGTPEYLLIYRHKLNDYTFPKGHVESGESLEQAAERETAEEAGVTCIIQDPIEGFEYKVHEKGRFIIRRVYNYLAEVTDQNETFSNPDLSEGTTSIMWLDYEEAHEKLSYDNLRSILEKGHAMLQDRYM